MTRDAATMIRFHAVNGMSRTQLERIYGRDAVLRVLGAEIGRLSLQPVHLRRFGMAIAAAAWRAMAERDAARARATREARRWA